MAASEDTMPTIGADIILKATLKGFRREDVYTKTATIFTATTGLPGRRHGSESC
jgi:ABC-type uncharacterized transport system ATPase subunit